MDKQVFIVHGWDSTAKQNIEKVLNILGISVADWNELVVEHEKPSPFNFDIVKYALKKKLVVIVLLSPDELVSTSEHLKGLSSSRINSDNPDYQARPNVLIELGMALALSEDFTVIVEIDRHRQISDLDGMNVVRTDKKHWAVTFAQRLGIAFKNAGIELVVTEQQMSQLMRIQRVLRLGKQRGSRQSRSASAKKGMGQTANRFNLLPDPINRSERLRSVFDAYGGPSSKDWRKDTKAPDYKVMKDAELIDEKQPLPIGTRVLVQQHYESEYNGKVGTIQGGRRHYAVEFDEETGLAPKQFHIMYLSRYQ
jgi:hypothetical protein